jgi:hypothetical protein
MTDVDGALKELVRILSEKNLLTNEEIQKIRSRYHAARTFSTADPI